MLLPHIGHVSTPLAPIVCVIPSLVYTIAYIIVPIIETHGVLSM